MRVEPSSMPKMVSSWSKANGYKWDGKYYFKSVNGYYISHPNNWMISAYETTATSNTAKLELEDAGNNNFYIIVFTVFKQDVFNSLFGIIKHFDIFAKAAHNRRTII